MKNILSLIFAFTLIINTNVNAQKQMDNKSANRKIILNNTYYFPDQMDIKWKFKNGEARNDELLAHISLRILNTKSTNLVNRFLLNYEGNWGGGNSLWTVLKLAKVDNNKVIILDGIDFNSTKIPEINGDIISVISYELTEEDSNCCPSIKKITSFKIDDDKFIKISEKKMRNND
jgi:hypothetical protein